MSALTLMSSAFKEVRMFSAGPLVHRYEKHSRGCTACRHTKIDICRQSCCECTQRFQLQLRG